MKYPSESERPYNKHHAAKGVEDVLALVVAHLCMYVLQYVFMYSS